ncbi:hypothetical protein FACS1894130_01700 [Spirochaetia bacterium]|nr:hypothetical protein FACS1894130_01700 [Spirochaetia bacterium]
MNNITKLSLLVKYIIGLSIVTLFALLFIGVEISDMVDLRPEDAEVLTHTQEAAEWFEYQNMFNFDGHYYTIKIYTKQFFFIAECFLGAQLIYTFVFLLVTLAIVAKKLKSTEIFLNKKEMAKNVFRDALKRGLSETALDTIIKLIEKEPTE